MKKLMTILTVVASLVLVSCSTTEVKRMDSDSVTDLSGAWNDTDARIIAKDIISKVLQSPRIGTFTT
ncbi:MAG: hypothetical protein ACRC0V_06170, partial [Fusobacteriaceae bacterium]